MEPVPTEDDAFGAGMSCCYSGQLPATRSIEYPTKEGGGCGAISPPPPPPKQAGLKSSLVKGSKYLKAKIAEKGSGRGDKHKSPPRSVAHQYFSARSPNSVSNLARPDLPTVAMDSLMDEEDTLSCSESSRISEPSRTRSPEEVLALEIGRNAHEYLEECFYTEANVLSREKFDAIPQVDMDDFAVMSHLGKGNFSDVHHVVRADGVPSGDLGNGMAMKSLRPQIQADEEQFEIGSEDLVHETALLANLRHRHIIKLHGRRAGPLEEAFVNGSYFIFLDKLNETLFGRMTRWKRERDRALRGPGLDQLEVAHAIADAMTYLHSKSIVFRDLKPDNVGFDAAGELKLFDFGFAIGLPPKSAANPAGFLYDRCGTPRYMAPEVGFSLGYGAGADVYSFGVLLWEMCALEKPFAAITCSVEFDRMVFMGGLRPKLGPRWSPPLRSLISSCWSATPSKRPRMAEVKTALKVAIRNSARSRRAIR